MKLFGEISKVDEEQRVVAGWASTDSLDSQGEIITREAISGALSDYMKWANVREMHGQSAVGTVQKAEMQEKGLWIEAHIPDDSAWKKVTSKVYKGFSVGGSVLARSDEAKNTITKMRLVEISLVDRPANPEATIELYKADVADPAASTATALASAAAEADKAQKGMWAVARLAEVNAMLAELQDCAEFETQIEGDKSDLPAKLQALLDQAGSVLRDMASEETAEQEDGEDVDCMPLCADECDIVQLADKPEGEQIAKRKFNSKQRKEMAKKKEAMPDGSFPIANRADLKNAIQAYGRAKDKEAAKKHIEARAKALGAEDLIPESWKSSGDSNKAAEAEITKSVFDLISEEGVDAFEILSGAESLAKSEAGKAIAKGFVDLGAACKEAIAKAEAAGAAAQAKVDELAKAAAAHADAIAKAEATLKALDAKLIEKQAEVDAIAGVVLKALKTEADLAKSLTAMEKRVETLGKQAVAPKTFRAVDRDGSMAPARDADTARKAADSNTHDAIKKAMQEPKRILDGRDLMNLTSTNR